jgi:hypothetical protein
VRALLALATIAAVCVLTGCGGDDELAIYLRARLGPDGPPGQRAPVLTPVEREAREGMSAARQAALEVLIGPSPEERARGVLDTISMETRLLGTRAGERAVIVDLAGKEPDFYGAAALVYSVTGASGRSRIGLRLDGEPCCVYGHDGRPLVWLTRRTFRYWQGEPCVLRTTATHRRCAPG